MNEVILVESNIKNVVNKICHYKKTLYVIGIVISLILVTIGVINNNFNQALIGILILYIECIIYSISNIKSRMYLFMFFVVLFVFILSRPTISMFRGDEWWYFDYDNVKWSLISIYLSLIFLLLGSISTNYVVNKYSNNKSKKTNKVQKFIIEKNNIISKVAYGLFCLSFVASLIVGIDKLKFMNGRSYEEYYTIYQNTLPFIINCLSSMTLTYLVIYLMTYPSKKMTYITLAMYIVIQLPMLVIGERGSTVIACIFAFLYIWYRNNKDDKEKWIRRTEKIIIAVSIPIVIIGLGIYNYTRSDEDVPTSNPITLFFDFFYKQGVTYDVLNIGHGAIEELPNKSERNYTFGPFIDYIKYNSISTKLFNIEPIEGGNSVKKATESNSFAHAMSYVTRGQEYLDGHGWGSSYLLETYADYGYIGIIIYSILMGIFLTLIERLLNRQDIISTIILYSTSLLYIVPRAEATGFLSFIIQIHYWIPIMIIIIFTYIISKKDVILNKVKEKKIENKKNI